MPKFISSKTLAADEKAFKAVIESIRFPSDILLIKKLRADSKISSSINDMFTRERGVVLAVFDALLEGRDPHGAVKETNRKALSGYYIETGLCHGKETANREITKLINLCAERLPIIVAMDCKKAQISR